MILNRKWSCGEEECLLAALLKSGRCQQGVKVVGKSETGKLQMDIDEIKLLSRNYLLYLFTFLDFCCNLLHGVAIVQRNH